MFMIILAVLIALSTLSAVLVNGHRVRKQREVEAHTIMPDELQTLIETSPSIQIFDVRLPLDFLAHSEVIPGTRRIAQRDLLADPSLIPKDEDTVVYSPVPGKKPAGKSFAELCPWAFVGSGFSKAVFPPERRNAIRWNCTDRESILTLQVHEGGSWHINQGLFISDSHDRLCSRYKVGTNKIVELSNTAIPERTL